MMQASQPSQTMKNIKSTPSSQASSDHYTKAAECHKKAAAEHSEAAKCCANGDHAKAEEHAKKAECHCADAQDHGKKAMAA